MREPKPKVVKTENGWEPAFWWNAHTIFPNGIETKVPAGYQVEPGFAKPTKAEAQAKLDADLRQCAYIDATSRQYQSQYASACGYHD